ncbi:MAG: LysM peptidoglycan-binding domain-containing protein [Pseudolabrys sp.]
MHDNLAHFEAVLAAMEHTGNFANTLPMIAGQTPSGEATLGTLVKLSSLLDADVVTPLTGYVQQIAGGTNVPTNSAQLAAGIQNAIQNALSNGDHVTVTDNSTGGNIDLIFSLDLHTTNAFSLTIGSKSNVELSFPSDLQGKAGVKVSDFNFETVIASNSKVLTDATAQGAGSDDLKDHFTLSGVAADVRLDVKANIPAGHEIDDGLLTLETTAATALSYGGDFHVDFAHSVTGDELAKDAVDGAAGKTSFLTGLAETTIAVDPFLSLAIPVKMTDVDTDIPGLGAGFSGAIGLTGNVFAGNWAAQVSGSGVSISTLHDFAALSPEKIVAQMESLVGFFSNLTNSDLTDIEIPFTHGTTIGEVLDFANNFKENVVQKLMPVNDLLGFSQGQTVTAADGVSVAKLVITPTADVSTLPATFTIDLTADGHTATLNLAGQYTDDHGNLHTVKSVDDLVGEINDLLGAADPDSALGTLASSVGAVLAVSSNTETLAITAGAVTLGGSVTGGDVVRLTVTNSKGLADGPVAISTTTKTTDTLADVANELAAAVNGDKTLKAAGITATAANGVLTVVTEPNHGTTSLSAPNNAIEFEAVPTGSDLAPASIGLTAPNASFRTFADLAINLGEALGLGDDITRVGDFLSGLGFSYDSDLNAIEFNISYATSFSLGSDPTETLDVSDAMVTVGGDISPGDTLSITIENPHIAGDTVTVNYVVQTGDTIETITTGLVAAINGTAAVSDAGLQATAEDSGDAFTIGHASGTETQSSITVSTGLSGAISFAAGFSLGDLASLSGSGQLSLTASLAASLTVGFNLDPLGAQANGVQMTVDGEPLGLATNIFHAPVWTLGTKDVPIAAITADQLAGATGLPDMQIILRDGTVGTVEVQHGQIIDTIGGGAPIVIPGTGTDLTQLNIQGTVAAGETVVVTVGYDNNSLQAVNYTTQAGDTVSDIAAGLAAAIDADTTLQKAGITAGAAANTLALYSKDKSATLGGWHSTGTETFDQQAVTIGDLLTAFNDFATGNVVVTVSGVPNSGKLDVTIGGSITDSDLMTLVISGPTLEQPVVVQHVVVAGDTLADTADIISTLINNNTTLQTAGITATYTSGDGFVLSGATSVTSDPHSLALTSHGESAVALTGSVTPGDVVSLTLTGGALGTAKAYVSYTVQTGDTLSDIADGLQAAINGNDRLIEAGVSANIDNVDPQTVLIGGDVLLTHNIYSNHITASSGGGLLLNGTPVEGDVVAFKVTPDGGTAKTAAYTVQDGDSPDAVIAKLADAIHLVAPSVSVHVEADVNGADSISVVNDRFLVDNGDVITLGVDPRPGDVLHLAVDGHAINVVVRSGYSSEEDVIASIVDAINDLHLAGVTADLSAIIDGATLGTVSVPTAIVNLQSFPTYSINTDGAAAAGNVLSIDVVLSDSSHVVASTALNDGDSAAHGLAYLADALNALNPTGVTAIVSGQISGADLSVPGGEPYLHDAGESIQVSGAASGTVSLNVGNHTVTYDVQVGDTSADIVAGLVDAVNAAGIEGVGAKLTMLVDGSDGVTVRGEASETVSMTQAPDIGPAVNTGDVLSLTFASTQLSAPLSLGYTVQSTDTLETIAAALAAEIHGNATLQSAGIDASVSLTNPEQIVVTGNPSVTTNPHSMSLSVDSTGVIRVTGTPAAGDVLAVAVKPDNAATFTASYVAQSTDSQADVIAKVADAIRDAAIAEGASFNASVKGTVRGVGTLEPWAGNPDNNGVLTASSSGGIQVTGAQVGEHLSLNVNGQEVDYVVQNGHTTSQDVVAGLVDAINNAGIKGVSASLSVKVLNASLTIPSAAGEELGVAPGVGGVTAVFDASDMKIHLFDATSPNGLTPATLGFINGTSASVSKLPEAPAGALAADTYYQAVIVASPVTQVDYSLGNEFLLAIGGLPPVKVTIDPLASRTTAAAFADAINEKLSQLTLDPTLIGLDPGVVVDLAPGRTTGHQGDILSVEIHNLVLPGGDKTITYTVGASETAAQIAQHLADAINQDTDVLAASLKAVVNGTTVSVSSAVVASILAASVNNPAETLTAATVTYDKLVAAMGQAFTVEGSASKNDVITLNVNDNGTLSTVSYTVVSGDSPAKIATKLAALIAAQNVDLNAVANGTTVVYSSKAGNTVAITDSSPAGKNSEFIVSSLTISTTLYNLVSASSDNALQAQAASYGVSISTVDTTLSALNGTAFVQQLGFDGTDIAGLTSPVGEITSGPLYSTTISDRFFFNNTAIVADLTLTLSNLDLQGAIGFIGFEAQGHGSLELEAALRLQSPDGSDYVTFHQLLNAVSSSTLSSFFSFTVGAPVPGQPWAELSIDSIVLTGSNEAGNVIADLANALVSPAIDIVFDNELHSLSDFIHAKPRVTVTGFDNINELKHLTAADILTGLQTILQVIDNDTGSQILDTTIPIIGVSIGDLLNFAQDFNTFLTNLQEDPAGTVAQINTAIKDALGSFGSNVDLKFQNGALMLSLSFEDGITTTLPFSLDLATLAADAGITLPSEITDIVGASGSGDLTVTASAALGLSFGIQLKAPAATAATPLLNVNGGKGVASNGTSASDLVIVTGGGRQFAVDLDAIATTATAAVNDAAKTITIGGTATAGETVSVTLDNAKLDGTNAAGSGAVTVTYTVHASDTPEDIANSIVQAIGSSSTLSKNGITATVSHGVVTVTGADSIKTKVGGNVQELLDVINNAAESAGVGTGFATLSADGSIVFNDTAHSAPTAQDAEALGFIPTVSVTGAQTVTADATGGLTASVANDNVSVTGTPTAGNTVTVTVNGHAASYTVVAGDHLADIDQKLVDAINLLKLNGVSVTVGGEVALAHDDAAATLGGSATVGDTISLTVHYGANQTKAVTYTAVAGDTLASEAVALAAAINADSTLEAAGVHAVATDASVIVLGDSATLSGTVTPGTGTATETVTAGKIEAVVGDTPLSLTSSDSIELIIDGEKVSLFIGADDGRTTITGSPKRSNKRSQLPMSTRASSAVPPARKLRSEAWSAWSSTAMALPSSRPIPRLATRCRLPSAVRRIRLRASKRLALRAATARPMPTAFRPCLRPCRRTSISPKPTCSRSSSTAWRARSASTPIRRARPTRSLSRRSRWRWAPPSLTSTMRAWAAAARSCSARSSRCRSHRPERQHHHLHGAGFAPRRAAFAGNPERCDRLQGHAAGRRHQRHHVCRKPRLCHRQAERIRSSD